MWSSTTVLMIVGLGNPGPQYALHRHNIGFMAIDLIADFYNFSAFKTKNNALISEGRIGGQKILLVKPQTFMNRSGQAVGELARFYKISLENILTIHDDLDLAPGKARIKKGGGAGGHNGLKDLDRHLGKDYWRLRLGIGHPGNPDRVSGYVLSAFSKSEETWLIPLVREVADQMETLVEGNKDLFLTRVNEATKEAC
jgi:peptidyl-tRNA hydrolase, PTH1 family